MIEIQRFKKISIYIEKNFLIFETFIYSKINIDIILAYSIFPKDIDLFNEVKLIFLLFSIVNISVFNFCKIKANLFNNNSKKFCILLFIIFIISLFVSFIFLNKENILNIEDGLNDKYADFHKKINQYQNNNHARNTEYIKILIYLFLFINNLISIIYEKHFNKLNLKNDSLIELLYFLKKNFEDSNKNGLIVLSLKNQSIEKEYIKDYETEYFFENIEQFLYSNNKFQKNIENTNYLNNFQNNNICNNKIYNSINNQYSPQRHSLSNIHFIKNINNGEEKNVEFFSSITSLNNYLKQDKKFPNNYRSLNKSNLNNNNTSGFLNINLHNNNNNILNNNQTYFNLRKNSVITADTNKRNIIGTKRIPYSSNNLSIIRDNIKINLPKRVSSNTMISNTSYLNPLDQILEISEGEYSQVINKNMIGLKKSSRLMLGSNNQIELKKLTPRNRCYLNTIQNYATFKLGSTDKIVKKSLSNNKNNLKDFINKDINKNKNLLDLNKNKTYINIFKENEICNSKSTKIEDILDTIKKSRASSNKKIEMNAYYDNICKNSINSCEQSEKKSILRKTKLSSGKISFVNYEDLKISSEMNQPSNSDILSKELFSNEDSSSQSSSSIVTKKSQYNEKISNANNSRIDYNIKINDDKNLYLEYCQKMKRRSETVLINKLNFISKKKNSNIKLSNSSIDQNSIHKNYMGRDRRIQSENRLSIIKNVDKNSRKFSIEKICSLKKLSNPDMKMINVKENLFNEKNIIENNNFNESEISKIKIIDDIDDSKIYINNSKLIKKLNSNNSNKKLLNQNENEMNINHKIKQFKNSEKNDDENIKIIQSIKEKENLNEEINFKLFKNNYNLKIKIPNTYIDKNNEIIKEENKTNFDSSYPLKNLNNFFMNEDKEFFNLDYKNSGKSYNNEIIEKKSKNINNLNNSSFFTNTNQNLLLHEKDLEAEAHRKRLFTAFKFNSENKAGINTAREVCKSNNLFGELNNRNVENMNYENNGLEKKKKFLLSRQKSNPVSLFNFKRKFESKYNKNINNLLIGTDKTNNIYNIKIDPNLIKNNKKIEFFKNIVLIKIFKNKNNPNIDNNIYNNNVNSYLNSNNNEINVTNNNKNLNDYIKLITDYDINIELIQLFNNTSENGCVNFNYFLNSFIGILDKHEDFFEEYDVGPFIIKSEDSEDIKTNFNLNNLLNTNNNNNFHPNMNNIYNNVNNCQEILLRRKIILISVKKIIYNTLDDTLDKKEKAIRNKYLIIIKDTQSFLYDRPNSYFTHLKPNSNDNLNNIKEKNIPSRELNNLYNHTNMYNPKTINLNINQNISINNNLNNELVNSNSINQNEEIPYKCTRNVISNNYNNFNNNYQNQNTYNNTFDKIGSLPNNHIKNLTNNLNNINAHNGNYENNQAIPSCSSWISNKYNEYGNPLLISSIPSLKTNTNDFRGSVSNSNFFSNSNQPNRLYLNNITEKLSAILHDFKHVIYDNLIFFEYLVDKYITKSAKEKEINNDKDESGKILNKVSNKISSIDLNTIKDELNYVTVMKDYLLSLIINITNFLSNNEFLIGEFSSNIDIIKIINIIVRIFNRRLEYENSSLKNENENDNNNSQINNNNFINNISNTIINNKKVDSRNNLDNNKGLFPLKNIKIKFIIKDPDNQIYTKVHSNQNLLISLFYNIISNSYKYTDNGEIIIELSVTKLNNKNNILVRISDSGKGIPQEILENWGKPFNFNEKTQGTGLGQFIISTLEKNLGLFIPKPEKNKKFSSGTVFKVFIPTITDNCLIEKGSNVGMSIIRNNTANPFPMNQNQFNQSSVFMRSTLIQDQTLLIEENFKNFIDYDENAIAKNNFFIRTIYIICLDDELMFLNALNKTLKGFISLLECYKFEVIFTNTFQDFLNELINLINKNIFVDFFIFDQNISEKIKGLDCARIVNYIYKIYLKEKYNSIEYYFFFVTEDLEIIKNCLGDRKIKKILRKDHIFGKMQINQMCIKIKDIIKEKDKDIYKPLHNSLMIN